MRHQVAWMGLGNGSEGLSRARVPKAKMRIENCTVGITMRT